MGLSILRDGKRLYLEESVFLTEVFTHIGLVEAYDGGRVDFTALLCGILGDTEPKGNIRHGIDDDSLTLRRVLSDTTEVGLQHVVSVQERHFTRGLNPHLVL